MSPATALTLLLLVDVSISVDDSEYALQRDGISAAFVDPGVQRAILGQGGACVAYIEWASTQHVLLTWSYLDSIPAMVDFAAKLAATQRSTRGVTYLNQALEFGVHYATTSPCGGRIVIDVSGDGCQYGPSTTALAQASAFSIGAQVNGLAILGDPRVAIDCKGVDLDDWYRENVAVDGFVIVAENFSDFARAIRQKLALEIAGVLP